MVNCTDEFAYHFSDVKKSWREAEDFCQKYGGHLTSIKDARENDFIDAYVVGRNLQNPYIGAVRRGVGAARVWKWLDNTTWTWQPSIWYGWEDGSKTTADIYGYYFGTKDKKWKWTAQPLDKSPFICKVPSSGIDVQKEKEKGVEFVKKTDCSKDIAYHFSTVKMNWTNAESFCQEHGGHLTSISSEEEKVFIGANVESRNLYRPYIGALKQGIGAARKWQWIDKTFWTWGPSVFWGRNIGSGANQDNYGFIYRESKLLSWMTQPNLERAFVCKVRTDETTSSGFLLQTDKMLVLLVLTICLTLFTS
eukprot:TCONS_00018684-protein